MPDISIIIVSYNVQYFLDQCVHSIYQSIGNYSLEVIIVDNASSDQSVQIIKKKYPSVQVIQNTQNVGFSKANNQGIALAKGKFVLILNPDTILSSDTIEICSNFLKVHDDAGAVCVRMIDGSGKYLPESKRGNPTFKASFMKMTGIYKLFPHSRWFNAYYLGDIGEFEVSEIEVMTGAFMFIRKEVLDQAGYFDEDFFMYGEDIDLSYRLRATGKNIYYLPTTSIIHFKGESTKKGSLDYIRNFYEAMAIFVRKHYSQKGSIYILLLQMAVYFRSLLRVVQNILKYLVPKIIDASLIILMLAWLRTFWGEFYFDDPNYIKAGFLRINLPIYTIIWISSAIVNGKYKNNRSIINIIKSIFYGTLAILIVYALLDQDYRNSRTIIAAGSVGTFLIFLFTACMENLLLIGRFSIKSKISSRYLIAGNQESSDRIKSLLDGDKQFEFIGRLNMEASDTAGLGNLDDLDVIVDAYNIDEVIFAQSNMSANTMIRLMSQNRRDVNFRMALDDATSILSSNSKNRQGELYAVEIKYNLNDKANLLFKRLLDILLSLLFLLISPVLILFGKQKLYEYNSIFSVLSGSKTWVSYVPHEQNIQLPNLPPGIFNCSIGGDPWISNLTYARNYTVWDDIIFLFRNIKK